MLLSDISVPLVVFVLLLSFALGLLVSYIAIRLVTRRKRASKEEILSKAHVYFKAGDENVSLVKTVISDEVKSEAHP